MPAPSKVELLPKEIRAELDRRLIESGFSDYQGLSDWLKEQGIEIGKSAIGNYGKKLESQLAELKLSHNFAQAYAQALPDDAGTVSQMLNGITQDVLYRLITQLHRRSQSLDNKSDLWEILRQIETATKALANVGRTDIAVRKYSEELKARAILAAESLKSEGDKKGIDAEFMHRIKTEVLGLF